jgi:hypothetical protein
VASQRRRTENEIIARGTFVIYIFLRKDFVVNTRSQQRQAHIDRPLVLTKAVLRASDRLGLNARVLSDVIGLSEATISRMKRGDYMLEESSKAFELSALLVRVFRSLDAITGGDDAVSRAWMKNPNGVLGGAPVAKIVTVAGLADVIAYLDARRAVV